MTEAIRKASDFEKKLLWEFRQEQKKSQIKQKTKATYAKRRNTIQFLRNSMSPLNLMYRFIPTATCDAVYYVDSFDRNNFINVNNLFERAHEERMAELEHIAYSLGAKRCSIELSEASSESGVKKKKLEIGEALKIKAPKIILVHNHPTGDPTPSTKDIQFTDKLYNAAKIFDIELLDHIVIGNGNFRSVFVETQKLANKLKGH